MPVGLGLRGALDGDTPRWGAGRHGKRGEAGVSRGRSPGRRRARGAAGGSEQNGWGTVRTAGRFDDPPLFETRYEWNAESLPTLILYPYGNSRINVYEVDLGTNGPRRSRGNLREMHHLPGPLGGDPTEIIELFEYDTGFGGCCGTNFVTRWTDGRGNVTSNGYDTNGNRIHTRHRIGSIVEDFEYNAFGQLTKHILPDNGSGSRREDVYTYYTEADGCMNGYLKERIIDEPGFALTTTYEYDCLGRLTRTIDPRGHDTLYEYNALDQVVRETSREVTDGRGVRYQRDTFYDANNNVVRVDVENIDDQGVLQPNSHFTTVYEYDVLNYLTRTCQEAGEYTGAVPGPPELPTCGGLPESEFITTEYEYDANRNRTLVRSGEAVEGRQPENRVRTLYDERDLVFQRIRGEGDAGQSSTQYDYDGNRNVKKTHEGLEDAPRVDTYVYDG